MQKIQVQVLDEAEQAAENERVRLENEQKEAARVALENRIGGLRKPEPGDRIWVSSRRGLPRRGRAGVLFVEDQRTELFVTGGDHQTPPTGAIPVSVDRAEKILNDKDLNVTTQPSTDAEAAALRTQLAERDSELAKANTEIERLRREARQAAPSDPNGGPARLRAQRKVSDPDGFGGKD